MRVGLEGNVALDPRTPDRLNRGMCRLVIVVGLLLAACGGSEDDSVALTIESPAPGAEVSRDSLDALGGLVANVQVDVEVTGSPARVA